MTNPGKQAAMLAVQVRINKGTWGLGGAGTGKCIHSLMPIEPSYPSCFNIPTF